PRQRAPRVPKSHVPSSLRSAILSEVCTIRSTIFWTMSANIFHLVLLRSMKAQLYACQPMNPRQAPPLPGASRCFLDSILQCELINFAVRAFWQSAEHHDSTRHHE